MQIATRALDGGRLAFLVERHDDDTAPKRRTIDSPATRNASSPSFSEIEFTMPLPCTHFRPASMTDHLELSIMIGTRDLGSVATRVRNEAIAFGVEHALVHVDVDHVGAAAHLLERDLASALVIAALDEERELLRAGDVGALADHHEERSRDGS